MKIELPYPPSVNHYWRHSRGRHFISEEGRRYREDVWAAVKSVGHRRAIRGPVAVEVFAVMPDRRRRDIDNIQKCLLDSLAHAGVIVDDSQIDRLVVERGPVEPPGCVIVSVEPHKKP